MTVTLYYITWLNYLGGFEYFPFTAEKEYDVDVLETGQTRKNLFPTWPNSGGLNADTIDRQTFRISKNAVVIRSQHLTLNQLEGLSYIRTSPLVQLVTSRVNRRTLIVDTESFKKYDEGDALFTMQFRVMFTDEIASQRL